MADLTIPYPAMSNFVRELRAGNVQWGLIVSYPAPGIVERVGRSWDWVWIDGQHGQLGYQDVLALVRTCDFMGCAPVVRVPSHEYAAVGMALDTNPAGIIVPMVQSVEEARKIVGAAKYPPVGNRSYGGRRVGDVRGRNYPPAINSETLVLAQIETEDSVEHAAAIAAVPGIDGLFYGPDDMFLRRGVPMETPKTAETLGDDLRAVATACRMHRKVAATLAFTPELIGFCLSLGYGMLTVAADIALLTSGSGAAAQAARALVAQNEPPAPTHMDGVRPAGAGDPPC